MTNKQCEHAARPARERAAAIQASDEARLRSACARALAQNRNEVESALFMALNIGVVERDFGLELRDVQIAAALALAEGKAIEMPTGEGKTLIAAIAAAYLGLSGRRVHVFTANDYLAARDEAWMRPVFAAWGLTSAALGASTSFEARREAYNCDVVYLCAREAGFDFLRDGLAYRADDLRGFTSDALIVDEADHILVDEARIPLVLAGHAETMSVDLNAVARCVESLREGVHFTVDTKARKIALTMDGEQFVGGTLAIDGMHSAENQDVWQRVHAALYAHKLLGRDVDYVVKENAVELVDAFTGRIALGRQWPWGVQRALEVKESCNIHAESKIWARVAMQHFIKNYAFVAALGASLEPAREELAASYELELVVIPPFQPSHRVDRADLVYRSEKEKWDGVVDAVRRAHAVSRPVLVGTSSVEKSMMLSARLLDAGVPHKVLNAENEEAEAAIIAEAGLLGAVTVSTNLAGRGTDIHLGGKNPKPSEIQALRALGGLLVIGTERHDSRRIDYQLRGRAARQGEPGESVFYLSLEDRLFTRYGTPEFLPSRASAGEWPSTDPRVSEENSRAQRILEHRHHLQRKNLFEFDRIVELDRRSISWARAELLARRWPEAFGHAPAEGELPHELFTACIASLDNFWSDHLLFLEDLREGIHLQRYGHRDPEQEFRRLAGDAFESGLSAAVDRGILAWQTHPGDVEAALDSSGIAFPSSTWTYQIDLPDDPSLGVQLFGSSGATLGMALFAPVAGLFLFLAKAWAKVVRKPGSGAAPRN